MLQGSTTETEPVLEEKADTRLKSVTSVTSADRQTQTAESPAQQGRMPCPRLTCGIIGGGLLWLCFFPVAWGLLSAVALVPILFLVRSNGRPRNIYFSAWFCGLLFFWAILQWMRVANPLMYYTWAMLATYCSLYIPAAVFLIRRFETGTHLPLLVTAPLVWVGLEFGRSILLTGFHWYFMGYALHDYLPLIQITDLGGVFLVSVLIVAVNVVLFEWLVQSVDVRRIFDLSAKIPTFVTACWHTGIVATLVFASFVYGQFRLNDADFKMGPRIALLQGNVGIQDEIIADGGGKEAKEKKTEIGGRYDPLWKAARDQTYPPQLIVWPETSFPFYWVESDGTVDHVTAGNIGKQQFEFREHARHCGIDVLFGVNRAILSGQDGKRLFFNSALMVRKSGNWKGEGCYDKIHRIPFGEYLPFVDWLPFMHALSPYDSPYSILPGEEKTRFKLGDYTFGVLICYEDTVNYLARQYGVSDNGKPPVDFLVNMSNEGWFMGTAEHEQHLANARFRAIESRRAMVRAVNMGISALIDSNGRVLKPIQDSNSTYNWMVPSNGAQELPVSEWHRFKKVAGVLTADVPIDSRTTVYAQWGDWVGWSCLIVVATFLLLFRLPQRWQPKWLITAPRSKPKLGNAM